MARIKCEFCGHYIEDYEDRCASCGAPNNNLKRTVSNTPRTISELQSWYRARKLPPEEVTRFFIGKNITEPRAFGIYEENGVFTVYKNKSDGSRAVRYQGEDEAYAVNELYMRLKEEILQQKNNNLRKQTTSYNRNNSYGSFGGTSHNRRRKRRRILPMVIVAMILPFVLTMTLMIGITTLLENSVTGDDYYLAPTGEIYFMYDPAFTFTTNEWWEFNRDSEEWFLLEEKMPDGELPDTLEEKREKFDTSYDLAKATGISQKALNIFNSRAFIDAGHHSTPSTAYYTVNGELYYFLDDYHSGYGDTDNTGWYKLNQNNEWEYYCSENDKEKLGEDLWYSADEYTNGSSVESIYDWDDNLASEWNISSFEDTSWYKSYRDNNEAYRDYQNKHSNSSRYDNDNDWSSDSNSDWDSGSSWDSGSTDWDSDW